LTDPNTIQAGRPHYKPARAADPNSGQHLLNQKTRRKSGANLLNGNGWIQRRDQIQGRTTAKMKHSTVLSGGECYYT
jgi:hypothetical protein